MLAQVVDVAPWRFQWHPEVWLLVAFLTSAYVYMVRVIGPRAVPAGQPAVTTRNKAAFAGAMTMLWLASDWPVHDIGEEYLYSVHMFQHMVLSYFMPPLVLLATPTWLFRILVGDGRLYEAAWLARGRGRAELMLLRMVAPEIAAGCLFAFIFVVSEHGVPEFLTVKGKTWHT